MRGGVAPVKSATPKMNMLGPRLLASILAPARLLRCLAVSRDVVGRAPESAIGTDRPTRPVGNHFRCWRLTGSAPAVPVLLTLTSRRFASARMKSRRLHLHDFAKWAYSARGLL